MRGVSARAARRRYTCAENRSFFGDTCLMDTSNLSPLVKLAITAAVLWFAYKNGSAEVKGMALGAAGVIALNQLPVVRDGAAVRLVA